MNIGFVGLGKLGLPVATTLAAKGHTVVGYDPKVSGFPAEPERQEQGWGEIIAAADSFRFGTLTEACSAEVVFVAVQTPHDPEYEGITPLPDERRDFHYGHLVHAVQLIAAMCADHDLDPIVAVISTVLPGTMEREIIPELGGLRLVYNPSFIAMGTVIDDFLQPEFVLLGGDETGEVRRVYEEVGIDRFCEVSIPSAELAKVAYNTFISMKLAVANTLGEICHKTAANADEVTGALKLADRRLISGAYLDAGMGDGGGCHPRDNIALSWLARELDLSFDLFEAAMLQRERHAAWLAKLLSTAAAEHSILCGILGVAYKPQSALVGGSPALLVHTLLDHGSILVDPYVERFDRPLPEIPCAWLIGCKHPDFCEWEFPEGSVIIDPWRYMPDREGVEVIRVGE